MYVCKISKNASAELHDIENSKTRVQTVQIKMRGAHIRTMEGDSEMLYAAEPNGDLQFYVLLNSISFISGRREVYHERLCAMELC